MLYRPVWLYNRLAPRRNRGRAPLLELLLKITLAPVLVVAATLAARRWGQTVGGIIIAIPIVAGPILLIFGIEQGISFVHHAARSALLGIVAVAGFCVMCRCCVRFGWLIAISAGWLAYGLIVLALAGVAPTVGSGLTAALGAIVLARWLTRVTREGPANPPRPPRWDLPARAAATAALVIALTGVASAVGPTLSGLLTPFPVATSVVVAFTLSQAGEGAAVGTLRGYLTGLPGFAAFFVVVALLT